MIIILANICILRTVLLGILSTFGATVEDIAWLYPVTWLSTSVCMAVCYGVVINKKASRIPKCVQQQLKGSLTIEHVGGAYKVLPRTSQNATALAAATLSESTSCAMGMQTVQSHRAMVE